MRGACDDLMGRHVLHFEQWVSLVGLPATSLTLVTLTNETVRIARNTIDEQSATTSAMPAMSKAFTLRAIRDLVEYLSTLTTKSAL